MATDEDLSNFYVRVGGRVREARTAAGFSQSYLAKRLGLSRASIGNIEAGRQRIQLHTLALIAIELESTTHQLLPSEMSVQRRRDIVPRDAQFTDESSRSFVESALHGLQDGKKE